MTIESEHPTPFVRKVIGAKTGKGAKKLIQKVVERTSPAERMPSAYKKISSSTDYLEAQYPLHTRPMEPLPPLPEGGWFWTQELKAHLLDYISDGGLVNDWCRAVGIGPRRVYNLVEVDEEFSTAYARACAVRSEVIGEEVLAISSRPLMVEERIENYASNGEKTYALKQFDNVHARKLAAQTRMELLKKWAPDKYGDKVAVSITDDRAKQIIAARRRVRSADE